MFYSGEARKRDGEIIDFSARYYIRRTRVRRDHMNLMAAFDKVVDPATGNRAASVNKEYYFHLSHARPRAGSVVDRTYQPCVLNN